MSKRILISWVGEADLRAATEDDLRKLQAPIWRTLQELEDPFDHVSLLFNWTEAQLKKKGLLNAQAYERWLTTNTGHSSITCHRKTLKDPMDLGAIYTVALDHLQKLQKKHPQCELVVQLSPGTSSMATVWTLLSPLLNLSLIQSSPEAGVRPIDIPFELNAEFIPALLSAGDQAQVGLASGETPHVASFNEIIHQSNEMKKAVKLSAHAAPHVYPVLLLGETGTGKELFAKAIHQASSRREHEMVVINCGAISEALIDSELFGHKKGAFTGADKDREGAFSTADGSTIFLDEIGELPLSVQARLLRVLQEGKYQRVGEIGVEHTCDVRVIAATHKNLPQMIQDGSFRSDLWYRLSVMPVEIPPVRRRSGDTIVLIDHLWEKIQIELIEKSPDLVHKTLSPSARNALKRHQWPGNVREMQHVLTRLAVLADGEKITRAHVDEALGMGGPDAGNDILNRPIEDDFALDDVRKEVETHYITRALLLTDGNKTEAATLLGIGSQQVLTKRMEKWKISK